MSIKKASRRKAIVWISRTMFGLAACLFCLLILASRTLVKPGHYSGGGGESLVYLGLFIPMVVLLFAGLVLGLLARPPRTERRSEPYVVPRWCVGLIGPLSIVGLFGVACAVPAVYLVKMGPHGYVEAGKGPLPGWAALLCGWCVNNVRDTVPWLANLPWLIGMICLLLKKYRLALGFGVAASLLGLTTLFYFHPLSRQDHPLIGYYFWQASLLALAVAAGLGLAGRQEEAGLTIMKK